MIFKAMLILTIPLVVYAQTPNIPEAAQEAFLLQDAANDIQILTSENLELKQNSCPAQDPYSDDNAQIKTEITCMQDQSDIENIDENSHHYLQLEIPKNEAPEFIKDHFPGEDYESSEKLYFMFGLPNDNKAMGLWGAIFKEDGDDYGNTHGTKITVGKRIKEGDHLLSGYNLTLNSETNVFTKRLHHSGEFNKNDRSIIAQNFTNETILNFLADSSTKHKLLYHKVGVGWTQLNSQNPKGFFKATGQQNDWHNFLKIYTFENAPDGKGIRSGVNLDTFIGIQKNIIGQNCNCRLRVYAETGAHTSTLLEENYFKADAGYAFYFQRKDRLRGKNIHFRDGSGLLGVEKDPFTKKSHTYKLGMSANSIMHPDGTQNQLTTSFGVKGNRAGISFDYTQPFGDLRNHTNYNMKNTYTGKIDPTMSVTLTFALGRIQKKDYLNLNNKSGKDLKKEYKESIK